MKAVITPGPLRGVVERVISSKSQAHRLLIAAALAQGPTVLTGVAASQDVEATCGCLRALGADITREGETLRVEPISAGQPESACSEPLLDCGESGSTLRFLLPVTAALGVSAAFTGRGKLPQRPLSPLYEQLAEHGVQLSPQGTFPLRLRGRMTPGGYTLAGNVSSQFISGLLLALPLLEGDSDIHITGPLESAPYLHMTGQALAAFGVQALPTQQGYHVPGGQRFRGPGTLAVEGDWSGAAFWLTAGALSPYGVSCGGLNPASAQGDRAVVELLRAFGATVERADGLLTAAAAGRFAGITLDASQIPDLVPVLAVAAAFAEGDTVIHAIERLRIKESDRVASVLSLLTSLGGRAEATEHDLIIHGRGSLAGGTVNAFGDHRIAMAAAVAGTRAAAPVTISGAEAVRKSYPGFFEVFRSLGGRAELIPE